MKRENLLEPMLGNRLSQRDLIRDLRRLHFVPVDQHGAVMQRVLKIANNTGTGEPMGVSPRTSFCVRLVLGIRVVRES